VYFEYIYWKFAGRLLDRVNTPLNNFGVGRERFKPSTPAVVFHGVVEKAKLGLQ